MLGCWTGLPTRWPPISVSLHVTKLKSPKGFEFFPPNIWRPISSNLTTQAHPTWFLNHLFKSAGKSFSLVNCCILVSMATVSGHRNWVVKRENHSVIHEFEKTHAVHAYWPVSWTVLSFDLRLVKERITNMTCWKVGSTSKARLFGSTVCLAAFAWRQRFTILVDPGHLARHGFVNSIEFMLTLGGPVL